MATIEGLLVDVIKYQLDYNKNQKGKKPPAEKYDIKKYITAPNATEEVDPLEPPTPTHPPPPPPTQSPPPTSEESTQENYQNDTTDRRTVPWKGLGGQKGLRDTSIVYEKDVLVGFILEGTYFSADDLRSTARDLALQIISNKNLINDVDANGQAVLGNKGVFLEGSFFQNKTIIFLKKLSKNFSLYFSNSITDKDQKMIITDYTFAYGTTTGNDAIIKGLKKFFPGKDEDWTDKPGFLLQPNYDRN